MACKKYSNLIYWFVCLFWKFNCTDQAVELIDICKKMYLVYNPGFSIKSSLLLKKRLTIYAILCFDFLPQLYYDEEQNFTTTGWAICFQSVKNRLRKKY